MCKYVEPSPAHEVIATDGSRRFCAIRSSQECVLENSCTELRTDRSPDTKMALTSEACRKILSKQPEAISKPVHRRASGSSDCLGGERDRMDRDAGRRRGRGPPDQLGSRARVRQLIWRDKWGASLVLIYAVHHQAAARWHASAANRERLCQSRTSRWGSTAWRSWRCRRDT